MISSGLCCAALVLPVLNLTATVCSLTEWSLESVFDKKKSFRLVTGSESITLVL